jgi:hypothetical protein
MHSTILIRDVLLLIHDDDDDDHCEIYHAIILLNVNDPLPLLLLHDDRVIHCAEIFHDEINYVDLRELKLPIDDGVLLNQVLCVLLHDDFFLMVYHPSLILLKVIHHEDGFVLHDDFYHGQVLLSLLYVYPQDDDDLHVYVPLRGVPYDLL